MITDILQLSKKKLWNKLLSVTEILILTEICFLFRTYTLQKVRRITILKNNCWENTNQYFIILLIYLISFLTENW